MVTEDVASSPSLYPISSEQDEVYDIQADAQETIPLFVHPPVYINTGILLVVGGPF